MSQECCYLGVGANLGEPIAQIESAWKTLASHPHIHAKRSSSLYASKPMGPQNQPDYVNAVFEIETTLAPLDLLDVLQEIEAQHQRVRGERWGARTLDLDLLYFGTQTINHPRLQVPHPGILVREFVVIPLAELNPQLMLHNHKKASELARQIDANDLTKIRQLL